MRKTIKFDKKGSHKGSDYELYKVHGTVNMILTGRGTFKCKWDKVFNVLFRMGKKFKRSFKYDYYGDISVTYCVDYNPVGNSYLCVYGWAVEPLMEFYIVESWGDWRPPGAVSKGMIEIDDGIYDVYETMMYESPSIEKTCTFKQFWSVRTNKKAAGFTSVTEHIKAWELMGMILGKIIELTFCVEGYESSGEAEIFKSEIKFGDIIVGKKRGRKL
jgi:hypothetical protein